MYNKTKLEIIEVARKLFAEKGMQRTTMNDIAEGAKRGRRTLYTYFKNKEEVIKAVISGELEQLRREVEIASRLALEPEVKLFHLIHVHMETMKNIVKRNGDLRGEFFRDIWLVERSRHSFDLYERSVIRGIFEQGIRQGIFEMPCVDTMAYIFQNTIKGLEVPFIYGRLTGGTQDSYQKTEETMKQLILNGISAKNK